MQMREPWFWRETSLSAMAVRSALWPFGQGYAMGQRLVQKFANPFRTETPIICVGNATSGGTGKTPFCIMLSALLENEGHSTCFLTRGYGGNLDGPLIVSPVHHSAEQVGDEALLLAKQATVIKARNKKNGARLADQQQADVIIMDDGFQNPSVAKTVSILLHPAEERINSPYIFPSGPMRESFTESLERSNIVVSTGNLPLPDWADFSAFAEVTYPAGPQRVVAFCGIARPRRFFDDLEKAGFDIAETFTFPDHHFYQSKDLDVLQEKAASLDARLITTQKDIVRIPNDLHASILCADFKMKVDSPDALLRKIRSLIDRTNPTDRERT